MAIGPIDHVGVCPLSVPPPQGGWHVAARAFANGYHRAFRGNCFAKETPMPKGYWIGHIDVSNPEGYQAYLRANGEVFRKYGARFVVRGGPFETVEGDARSRNVVIEFPDYATA